METQNALQWEMYGRGTAVEFQAFRAPGGFKLLVRRDHDVLLTTEAPDAQVVLRKSSELRGRLQELGFLTKPTATRTSHLGGGVCWGPAAPLHSSIVDVLVGHGVDGSRADVRG